LPLSPTVFVEEQTTIADRISKTVRGLLLDRIPQRPGGNPGRIKRSLPAVFGLHQSRASQWQDLEPLALSVARKWMLPIFASLVIFAADSARYRWELSGISWILLTCVKSYFEFTMYTFGEGRMPDVRDFWGAAAVVSSFLFVRKLIFGNIGWNCRRNLFLWGFLEVTMFLNMSPPKFLFYSHHLLMAGIDSRSVKFSAVATEPVWFYGSFALMVIHLYNPVRIALSMWPTLRYRVDQTRIPNIGL
jgi:hypothetical protein